MDEEITSHKITLVKEMILDEEKLVTYITLSKELCLHVNACKKLLNAVVEDIKKNQTKIELNINYIISGLYESNKARTTVCSEADIESIRNTFNTIFFEHIYSVSKGQPRVDNIALMLINKFEDFSLCVGLIKDSACVKRTTNEIRSTKTSSENIDVTSKPQKSKSDSVKVKEENKVSNNTNETSEPKKAKSVPTIKKEELSPKKDTAVNNKQKYENKAKPQKGIAGFFNKQSDDKTVQKSKKIAEKIVKVEQNNIIKEEKMEIDDEKTEKIPHSKPKETVSKKCTVVKTETVATNVQAKDSKPKNKPKNKSLNEIKKNAQVDKKRKRVLLVSDSESDEDKDPFADDTPVDVEDLEDEIPPTPTLNTVKITSGIMNPKKRRKIVDKTYTDEEGYILTKKVEVYESCSDNEDEIDKKENVMNSNHVKKEVSNKKEISPKETTKESKSKKKVSPQSGKQSTLMNFFKKV